MTQSKTCKLRGPHIDVTHVVISQIRTISESMKKAITCAILALFINVIDYISFCHKSL